MPKAIVRIPNQGAVSAASERSNCGLGESLSSGFANIGGIHMGHSDLPPRKRAFENTENVPPHFVLDGAGPKPSGPASDKPSVSLLDLAAQQQTQSHRKRRCTAITASSPGGYQNTVTNPRRMAQYSDSSILRSIPLAYLGEMDNKSQQRATGNPPLISTNPPQKHTNMRGHLTHPPQRVVQNPRQNGLVVRQPPTLHQTIGAGSASSSNNGAARLRRMPKRNLKPLDFSSLHRPGGQSGQSAGAVPPSGDGTTSTAPTNVAAGNFTAFANKSTGARSAALASGCAAADATGARIVLLPVSPAQSSPISTLPFEPAGRSGLSPEPTLCKGSSVVTATASAGAPCSTQPTPPYTGHRKHSAFSGLLASAYERASGKRSSKRALNFGGNSSFEDEESLQACDPVLGPRCPVIGNPRGLFNKQKMGIDSLKSEQVDHSETKLSNMAHTAHRAQAAFEAAVTQNKPRGRPPGKKTAKGLQQSALSSALGSASGSKRAVSVCKYCNKQYKYQSKLASHEQHCSSRLEALLYSADENEHHIIHCVCGPRHDRPTGERDELPMVQCDNCQLWLHIECMGVDEDNLPDEFYCPRCDAVGSSAENDNDNDDMSCPSTPKHRQIGGGGESAKIMSPESDRLANLLAGVPNDGSETDEEPMYLHAKGGKTQRYNYNDPPSTDETVSILDAAEVARFHRQGSALKRCYSPVSLRLAQSETNKSPALSPSRRRRIRKSKSGPHKALYTDVVSSDFLGLPLPETIFTVKPSAIGTTLSVGQDMYMQQQSMDDMSQFLLDPQPQWSLAQLSNMLGGAGGDTGDMLGGDSSFYFDQALADLGFGLGPESSGNMGGDVNGPILGSGAGETPLSELVDLPVDNEFSALLDSIASGSPGTDNGFGCLLTDELMLELNTTMAPVSTPVGQGAGASRIFGSRINGTAPDIGHGSSSTITLMHANSSALGSRNNSGSGSTAPSMSAAMSRAMPLSARPPSGMSGLSRGHTNCSAGSKRGIESGANQQQMAPYSGSVLSSDSLLNLGQPSTSMLMHPSASIAMNMPSTAPASTRLDHLVVGQLLGSAQLLDWQTDGDALEQELEGLINFDA